MRYMNISAYIEPCQITFRRGAGFKLVTIIVHIHSAENSQMHQRHMAHMHRHVTGFGHTLGRSAMILRIVTPARVLSKGGMTSVPSLRMNPTFIAGPSHTYPSASTNMPCPIPNIKTTFIPLPHTHPTRAAHRTRHQIISPFICVAHAPKMSSAPYRTCKLSIHTALHHT
jgi:hypothetical protein